MRPATTRLATDREGRTGWSTESVCVRERNHANAVLGDAHYPRVALDPASRGAKRQVAIHLKQCTYVAIDWIVLVIAVCCSALRLVIVDCCSALLVTARLSAASSVDIRLSMASCALATETAVDRASVTVVSSRFSTNCCRRKVKGRVITRHCRRRQL